MGAGVAQPSKRGTWDWLEQEKANHEGTKARRLHEGSFPEWARYRAEASS